MGNGGCGGIGGAWGIISVFLWDIANRRQEREVWESGQASQDSYDHQ